MMNRLTNFLWLVAGTVTGCLSLIVGLIAVGGGPAHAQVVGTQKPNILFIMGDDIGWMQPSIYHRGLMVGETPTSTASAGGRNLHGLRRHAELHIRT